MYEELSHLFYLTLQTSQSFLLQKMLQKILRICLIISAFFEPRNQGKIWDLFKNFQIQKILIKAQVSLAFFDGVNCNNEYKPVQPQLSKNDEKTCAFVKIFWHEKFWINSMLSLNFLDQKMVAKLDIFLGFFGTFFWIQIFWDVCSVKVITSCRWYSGL